MKNLVVFLFLILLFVDCSPRQNPSSSTNSSILGSIDGKFEHENAEPLIGAEIILSKKNKLIKASTTDANGYFKFDSLAIGTYTLQCNYIGYNSYIKNKIVVKNETNVSLGRIKLKEIEVMLEKPIIYLYPTEATEVNVQLDYDGELTHTYPKYPKNGWTIQAETDGTLTDKLGKKYYALYWEGKTDYQFNLDKGFVVKGDETIDFMEDALEQLGLNRREANEFIIYWLPMLESNPYNLIHFSTAEYESIAKLNITPTPETLIRVMMLFKPLDTPISIEKQDISALKKERKGFTVVEWGGQKLPQSYPIH